MRQTKLCGVVVLCSLGAGWGCPDATAVQAQRVRPPEPGVGSPCRPLPLEKVKVDGFLGRRIDRNVQSMLAGLESPIPASFEALAREEKPVIRRSSMDKDLHNWIEGASYAVAYGAPERLSNELDRIAALVLKQQRPEGYITSLRPSPEPALKAGLNGYVAGHFFEGAVAHFRATGRKDLLDAACRWADWMIGKIETKELSLADFTQMHQEIELALVRLYQATGHKRYLDLARDVIRRYDLPSKVGDLNIGKNRRHAVRVGYLLAGAAELYLETGEREFLEPLLPLWDELVSTRLYITGGTGLDEIIAEFPHDLPQAGPTGDFREIAETCASVAMMLMARRMHRITGESRHFNVLETILYNSFLGALSLDQKAVFYFNPLRVVGDDRGRTDLFKSRTRRTRLPDLHRTSCCIPNAWRFLALLPEYIFCADDEGIRVNLFTSTVGEFARPGGEAVKLAMETAYPHEGSVTVRVDVERPVTFALRMRIPGWCRRASLRFPGGEEKTVSGGGYARIDRLWKSGDLVILDMDMPPRMLFSAPGITANTGRVAFARGPLVYCLEQEDAEYPIERFCGTVRAGDEVSRRVEAKWRPDLLEGVYVLRVPGVVMAPPPNPRSAYFEMAEEGKSKTATLIPLYARANRKVPAHWLTLIPRAPAPRTDPDRR